MDDIGSIWYLQQGIVPSKYNFFKSHWYLACPDSKGHGANIGPIWGRQDPGGPHVGPMNFAIWVTNDRRVHPITYISGFVLFSLVVVNHYLGYNLWIHVIYLSMFCSVSSMTPSQGLVKPPEKYGKIDRHQPQQKAGMREPYARFFEIYRNH